MRSIPGDISEKIQRNIQTRASHADPSASIWISRPTTPMVSKHFLEKQTVLSGSDISDTSIAVRHPKRGAENTEIFIAYIENGVAHAVHASHKMKMSAHAWVNTGFSEPADYVSIAFDGTMSKDVSGNVEFVTQGEPWIFWSKNGVLKTRQLGQRNEIILAEHNCTAVTAVRAMWSEVGSFDFGLVVFFLLSGNIYYRQLIREEWTDASPVLFGPAGVTYVDIAASRTWDYRIVVQAKATNGMVYELFTQFEGVAKQSTEHLEIGSVDINGQMIEIKQTNTSDTEHIGISAIDAGALYGGLYGLGQPSILYASNILTLTEVDGDEVENYGLRISVRFAEHLNPDSVVENLSAIVMRDSIGVAFTATKAETVNGLDWAFTLPDFNNAVGRCTVSYTPGTLYTMAGTIADGTYVAFTPENLTPSAVKAPEILEVYND